MKLTEMLLKSTKKILQINRSNTIAHSLTLKQLPKGDAFSVKQYSSEKPKSTPNTIQQVPKRWFSDQATRLKRIEPPTSSIIFLAILGAATYFGYEFLTDKKRKEAKKLLEAGDKLLTDGNYEAAEENYSKALLLNPHDPEAYNKKGMSLARQGKHQEAIECYDKALELNPQESNFYFNKGISLASLEKYPEAIECYDRSLELDPQRKEAKKLLEEGDKLYTDGNFESAQEHYNKVLLLTPHDREAYNKKGKSLARQGKYQEAIEYYDKALELNPQESKFYFNKGISLAGLEKYPEAIECYDHSLKFNPQDPIMEHQIYTNKGRAFAMQDKYPEAIETLDKALQLDPEASVTLSIKGYVLVKQDKYSEAIISLDHALAYSLKNVALAEQGKYQEADYTLIYNLKGVALGEQGKYQEAIENFDKALQRNPKYADAYSNIGSALKDQGEYQEAIKYYDKAILLNNQNPIFYYEREIAQKELQTANSLLNKKELPQRKAWLRKLQIDSLPTHYECAVLSNQVYDDQGGKNLPPQWKLLATTKYPDFKSQYDQHGYFGAAYQHEDTKQIVIAHRGTVPTNWKTLEADIQLFYNKLPEQFKVAHRFAQRIKKEHNVEKLTYVGHSLGGALAELSAWEDNTLAVTFDSPGCKEIIEIKSQTIIHPQQVNVICYLSDPNIINTMAPHVGLQIRIFPSKPEQRTWLDTMTNKVMPSIFSKTIDRHLLTAMIGAFDKDTGLPRLQALITQWPDGPRKYSQFENLCISLNSHDLDPRVSKLTDAEDRFVLKIIGYQTQDFEDKKIPLKQFSPKLQEFLLAYPQNKDKNNTYQLPELILVNYKIEEINGEQMVVVTHPSLTAKDFRYSIYQLVTEQSKGERMFSPLESSWKKSPAHNYQQLREKKRETIASESAKMSYHDNHLPDFITAKP